MALFKVTVWDRTATVCSNPQLLNLVITFVLSFSVIKRPCSVKITLCTESMCSVFGYMMPPGVDFENIIRK